MHGNILSSPQPHDHDTGADERYAKPLSGTRTLAKKHDCEHLATRAPRCSPGAAHALHMSLALEACPHASRGRDREGGANEGT